MLIILDLLGVSDIIMWKQKYKNLIYRLIVI